MSDKVIRNGIPVVFFVLLFIHPIVNSADYILDTPGAKLTLKGTTDIVGIDTYAIIQTQLTKDPQIRKDSSEKWIIHENRTTVGDQQDKIQLKAYVIKPDGIYCVAQSEKADKPLEKLSQEYKIVPIPAEKNAAWDVKFTDEGKKVNLKYRVISADETIQIGEKSYQTLHLQAVGDVEVFGMHVPITKDVWLEKTMGTIKSTSIQKIQDKETHTELVLSE